MTRQELQKQIVRIELILSHIRRDYKADNSNEEVQLGLYLRDLRAALQTIEDGVKNILPTFGPEEDIHV